MMQRIGLDFYRIQNFHDGIRVPRAKSQDFMYARVGS